MRSQIRACAAAIFLIIRSEVNAQDLLGLFFDRTAASSISGGDPFAPLKSNDVASSRRVSGEAAPAAQIDSWIDNIYRETRADGNDQNLQRNVERVRVQVPLSGETRSPILHVDYQSAKMSGSFDVDPKDQASYDGKNDYAAVGAVIPLSDAVDCDVGVQKNTQENSVAPGYELGFSYQNSDGLVTVTVKDLPRLQFLALNIAGIGGILPLDYVQKGGEVDFSAPVGNMSFLINGHYDYLSPLSEFTRSSDSHFTPDGNTRGLAVSVLLDLSQHMSALCSYGMEAVEASGNFYSQASSYGALNSFLFEDDFFQTGVRYAAGSIELLSDIKWSVISGAATGFAESWPFVSITQSSLSQGRFDGSGNIRMLQEHAGATFSVLENLRMGIGVNVVQLTPNLHMETWQTMFLSIGEKDLQTMAFPYREIDGMILSGGLTGKIGGIGLTYSFSQIVPLRVVGAANSNPVVVHGPFSASRTTHSSGGQFHQIAILFFL